VVLLPFKAAMARLNAVSASDVHGEIFLWGRTLIIGNKVDSCVYREPGSRPVCQLNEVKGLGSSEFQSQLAGGGFEVAHIHCIPDI
jgi:hypothetical protein